MLDMLTPAEVEEHTATIMRYPNFKERYEARYSPPLYDVEVLAGYPDGTLAHTYGAFMKKHGYSSDWYPVRDAEDPLTYMRNRLYQTHDFIHTTTGFDGSLFGEVGVQAFYLGQMPEQPLPCAVMTSSFFRMLNSTPTYKDRLMEVLHIGYEMGKQAQPVLFRKWENDFATDIGALRETLHIKAYNPKQRPVLSPAPFQNIASR